MRVQLWQAGLAIAVASASANAQIKVTQSLEPDSVDPGSVAIGQDVVPAYGVSTGRVGSTGGGAVDVTDVYDNSLNLIGFLINGADFERGDGLTLDGTDRAVTLLSLFIHSNGGDAIADLQARIYVGGDAGGGDPGAMLWESAVQTGVTIFGGTGFYDFIVPEVVVPDEITWTLEMTNVTPFPGEVTGSRFIHPPTLGSSEDWVWTRTAGVWTQNVYAVGPNNSYGAYITAVLGPSCPCACNFDTSTGAGICDFLDFAIFGGLFVAGDPCACDIDTSTGPGICDFLDYTIFAGQFAAGCP